ncbi:MULTISPECIES: DNA polymerase [unclassified Vibrio]|uniref:DNA polymerase n=1 Tax=unclassified Vibrio TaxID=2614977 RepID=UPI0035526D42
MNEAELFNNKVTVGNAADVSDFMREMIGADGGRDKLVPPPLDMTLCNDIPSDLTPLAVAIGHQPMRLDWATGDAVYMGIDSEYQYNEARGGNEILSYQVVAQSKQGQCSIVVHPKSGAKEHRWEIDDLIAHVLEEMFEQGLVEAVPEQIIVFGHFLRADLTTFSDFWKKQKTTLRGVRRTVASAMQEYGVDVQALGKRKAGKDPQVIESPSGEKYRTKVRFVDTLALSPNGSGLSVIGDLIGLPKLELPQGYTKDEMRKFMDEQPELFKAYALRDAEISLAYGLRMFKFATVELGLSKCPITLGAMGVAVFQKMLKESGVDKREAFGEREITTQHWNNKLGRPHTKKELVPTDARELFEHLAIRCYMGGRNECFTCGPSDIGTFYDFDLAGAYTTGMVDIRPLDYDRAYMSSVLDDYCGHVCGFARVRFSFPEGTRFPCFAVHHNLYGLYFPMTGETYTTAPEIELARNMGATIEILQGVVVPWVTEGESLFLAFVRMIREKRSTYLKKSYEESMWKEIGNSLYGKTAQGLRDKTAFELANGLTKDIPRSAITNPYFAAHTTGFVRAVIGELLASVPTNRQVISVTTDGFLTDAPMNELNVTGALCARFNAHNELVTNYLN